MYSMPSQPEYRILAWLHQYPPSMENSWDVIRELSLPGIAEGLGVGRSALNKPLNSLEKSNLISKRAAHVIGGGSRKRHVYHITEQGRAEVEQEGLNNTPIQLSKIIGEMPPQPTVFGREKEIAEFNENLAKSSVSVVGMPGIGKTTLVAKCLVDIGKKCTIRWANASKYSDIYSLCEAWQIGKNIPQDEASIVELITQNFANDYLVIDDYNLIVNRHTKKISNLINLLCSANKTKLILISSESVKNNPEILEIKLESLDPAACVQILGDSLPKQKAMEIANSLGCHPLALKLYQPTFPIPEKSTDIVDYVDNIVLNDLDENLTKSLNYLISEPYPITASKFILEDMVGELDEKSFLRYFKQSKFLEAQHLIRNVKRLDLSDAMKLSIHQELATHWSKICDTSRDKSILLHHKLKSDVKSATQFLHENFEELIEENSNAIAVFIDEAITDSSENNLHYFACKVAVSRGEYDVVDKHLSNLTKDQKLEINRELALYNGELIELQKLTDEMLQTLDMDAANKLAVSTAARLNDDCLPGHKIPKDQMKLVKKYISSADVANMVQDKQSLIVAISILQQSIALSEENLPQALDITQQMEALAKPDDPIILMLKSKIILYKFSKGMTDMDETSRLITTYCELIPNSLYRSSTLLSLIEKVIDIKMPLAADLFSQIEKPKMSVSSRAKTRYDARWWYINGLINPNQRMLSLRQCLIKYRQAGCSNCVSEIERLIHAEI